MWVPYGPRRISNTRQVAIPDDLMKAARLEQGDYVHFILCEDPPGIAIVPVEVISRWIDRGRRLDLTAEAEPEQRADPTS